MGLTSSTGERLNRIWRVKCSHCEEEFMYPGNESDLLAALVSEGWVEVAGFWYCDQCLVDVDVSGFGEAPGTRVVRGLRSREY